MKTKKEQQKELKKIEVSLQQLELLSIQSGLVLDDLMEMRSFPDISEQRQQVAFHQAVSRQQVFERSQKKTSIKDQEKKLVKVAGRR